MALIRNRFPQAESTGIRLRSVAAAAGQTVTIAYISGLMAATDLERLVLAPLSRGIPAASPDALLGAGHFPAPEVRVVGDARALQTGLLAGLAAVHVDGHAGALLVGSGGNPPTADAFGPDLSANVARLRLVLRHPGLRVEELALGPGRRSAVAYLQGVAPAQIVRSVRTWAAGLSPQPPRMPWWLAFLGLFRLPPAMAHPAPAAVAAALRRGYVAVLADHLPGALLAPTTLELALSGPGDVQLPPFARRLAAWGRIGAAILALVLCSGLVATVAYHHSMLPAPFLVALSSGRQNPPLPLIMEVLLVSGVLGDVLWATALRLGGLRMTLLAYVATVLAAMAALQAGVVGPVPATAAVASATAAQGLPTVELSRTVRAWAYVFFAGAAVLGIYGMSLVAFALMAYVAHERPLGHPLRCAPEGACP